MCVLFGFCRLKGWVHREKPQTAMLHLTKINLTYMHLMQTTNIYRLKIAHVQVRQPLGACAWVVQVGQTG